MIEKIPNPDNIPGAVTSGYQRQNTNMYMIQTGLDTTEPHDNGAGVITIPAGGIVEMNGNLFVFTALITLNKPDVNTAYWIAITDNNNGTATAQLVTRPGVWSRNKQGCYRTDGRRTLNWVSRGGAASLEASVYTRNTKGSDEREFPAGWYLAELRSGSGNGRGNNANNSLAGDGGIPVQSTLVIKIFFNKINCKYRIKVGGSGGNGRIGGNGQSAPNGEEYSGGGGGGGSGSGESSSIDGVITTEEIPAGNGGNGGNAFYSQQGSTGYNGGGGGGGGEIGGSGGNGSTANGVFVFSRGKHGNLSNGGDGGQGSNTVTPLVGIGGRINESGTNGGTGRTGGGGGGKGIDGKNQPNGAAGGIVTIRPIRN